MAINLESLVNAALRVPSADRAHLRSFLTPTDIGPPHPTVAVHLAVFVEPFLRYVLEGRKTVESRFSVRPIPPYRSVAKGDVILLKRSGGPVVGMCEAAEAWDYVLDPTTWRSIRAEYAVALCAQDAIFWSQRQHARYATLIRIANVRRLEVPFEVPKRDRRGWVVFRRSAPPPILGI